MIGPAGLDDGSRLSAVSSQGCSQSFGPDGHDVLAATRLGKEFGSWTPAGALGSGGGEQYEYGYQHARGHAPVDNNRLHHPPTAGECGNNNSTISEEESEDFGNFCQRVAASIGLSTPGGAGPDAVTRDGRDGRDGRDAAVSTTTKTPLAAAAAAYNNTNAKDAKQDKGKAAAGDSVEVRVILTDTEQGGGQRHPSVTTWASAPPPAVASASDGGSTSRRPSDLSNSADVYLPYDNDERRLSDAQAEAAIQGHLQVNGHDLRDPYSYASPAPTAAPAWESQGWAQPLPTDANVYPSSGHSAQLESEEQGGVGQGWALQSLTREEQNLEDELYSLNHEFRDKLSAGQAQQLAEQAMQDISSALNRGGSSHANHRDSDPRRHSNHSSQLDTSAGHHSQLSSGPSEYVPGQVSEDMYVPSGGSRRAGNTCVGSPSPSYGRAELWQAAPQHINTDMRSRSPSPRPSAVRTSADSGEHMLADAIRQSWSGASSPYAWQEGRPRAGRGREELDNRVADRLYGGAVDQRQRRELQRRSALEEQQETALNGCTFQPAICRKSSELGRSVVRQALQGQQPKPQRRFKHPISRQQPQQQLPVSAQGAWSYGHLFDGYDDDGTQAGEAQVVLQVGKRGARPASAPRQRQNKATSIEEFLQGSSTNMRSGGGGPPSQGFHVRGFDHTAQQGNEDYEVTLAASVARARRSPPAAPVDAMSVANSHLSSGQFSELGEHDQEAPPRPRPDDAVVTRACLRLYEKGLQTQNKLHQKRRQAHAEEQKMSQAAFKFIQSRSRSPGPRVPPGGRRETPPRNRADQRDTSPANRRAKASASANRPLSAPSSTRTKSPEMQRSPARPRDEKEFQGFLARQNDFLKKKEAKVNAAISVEMAPKPSQVSSGSRRILAKQEDAARRLGEELFSVGYPMHRAEMVIGTPPSKGALGTQTIAAPADLMADTVVSAQKSMSPRLTTSSVSFMQRLEMAMSCNQRSSPSSFAQMTSASQKFGVGIGDLLPKECTFQPQITQRAANRKPRSPAEMSEGDRLRKEAWRQEMLRESQRQQMEGVTFAPQLLNKDVPGRLCVNNPHAYREFLEQRRQNRETKAAQQQARQAEDEVSGCTFAPQICRSPPRHMERMARSHAARVAAGLSPAYSNVSPERQWR